MKNISKYISFVIIFGCGAGAAFAQNYKIKQSTTISGQKVESTIYVKNPRKRSESGGFMGMGADVATIEQCDLKRTVKVNDKKKLYFIEPFPSATTEIDPAPPKTPTTPVAKVTKGGTITMTSSVNDTGERKQMFGLTARHIKTSMKMESSPDACSQSNMAMETDGWYVDLPQFSCPMNLPSHPMAYQRPVKSGCQDRMVVKETGGGKLGFPLQVTTSMNGEGGFSQTVETIEFSKATLDDSLFDVPTSYTLAQNENDLSNKPDFSAMMRSGQSGDDDEDKPKSKPAKSTPTMPMQTGTPSAKKAGTIRIGVFAPTNRGGEAISITNMQAYLAQKLTSGNVEGVAVTSETEAKAFGCDYMLTSDFSKLKQTTASKIGGMFGRVTNTDTSASRTYDTQVDFKLVSLKSGQTTLQNKAASKTENDVDRAAEGVLAMVAVAVLGVAK